LWYRNIQQALRELGVGFVPHDPLGKSLLTGKFALNPISFDKLAE
jgi:aryl-alcohol dehydrogenase-like predicted oxidoreductase